MFAGEATHSSFYSTVHGAFLSGRKAAYYLLDVDPNESIEDKNTTLNNKQKNWSFGLNVASNLINF